ncbi:hypothetical protein KIN20_028833 [Parelaphostrongylus tenuis]|uniref:Uncharacterized protein n=1 Tax=Parelaphostrongylus tenuis TaxID=148309 RepID=A0AAD5WF10_PARTN|nr:hypothetical protein KIN20_028833 [Parelaphostrongylus tenuis]
MLMKPALSYTYTISCLALMKFGHLVRPTNQHVWKVLNDLKIGRDYEFTKSERILAGKPITDLVEIASSSDLTLVRHFRDLISSDWENGCILLIADRSELANARDHLTVLRNTPLELFGEEGFHAIEVSSFFISHL